MAEKWSEKDWKTDPLETKILNALHLSARRGCHHLEGEKELQPRSLSSFLKPHKDFVKLNFDGASKGNSGLTAFGGILQDEGGRLVGIFVGHCGDSSNNMSEMIALKKDLQLAIYLGVPKIQISEDSKLVINISQKIINGATPSKLVRSWRLESLTTRIKVLQDHFPYAITQHTLSWKLSS